MAEKSTLGLAPCSFNYDTKKLHQFFNFTREMSDVFVTILVTLVLVLCEPTQWSPSEFNCGAFSAFLGTLQTNTDGSYSLAFCQRQAIFRVLGTYEDCWAFYIFQWSALIV